MLVGAATLLILTAGVVVAPPVRATTMTTVTTFTPSADASVRDDKPTKNYGAALQLAVDASPRRASLLSFAVNGVGGSTVTQAVLRLRVEGGSPVGGDLYPLADTSWSERSVTWDTAPPPSSTVPLGSLGKVSAGTWVSIDVTGAVTGDGIYGFRLQSTSTNGAAYDAREAGAGLAPRLVLTVDPPATDGPTVTLTAPWGGSAVAGAVMLAADANPTAGAAVTRVDFRVDGLVVASDPVAPFAALWNSGGGAGTTHTLDAVMVDSAGNQAVSAPVTVLAPPDVAPPTRPAGLVAATAGAGRVNLSWAPADDDVAVAGYQVLRDGVALADATTTTRFVDWGVAPAATYRYTVVALDAAGHLSAASAAATVTTPAAPAAPPVRKAQIGGLVDRKGLADPSVRDVVNAFVVRADWADVQPVDGPLPDGNPIDVALATARQLNAADPTLGLRLKLRIFAGSGAPEWAKELDGPPLTLCDPAALSDCATVPRFWTDRFRDAYQRLQDLLAARYDAAPEILDTVVDRCSTLSAEPLLRQATLAANLGEYDRAGYSAALDDRCQRQELDAHRAWATTRSSLALNPYQRIDTAADPPGMKTDESYTETVMAACRQTLGSACVLGNNSIRDRSLGPVYDQMYAAMAALGPPLSFQTASLNRVGNLNTVLSWAESQGAGMVELPEGYETSLPLAQLAGHDSTLEAQAVPAG